MADRDDVRRHQQAKQANRAATRKRRRARAGPAAGLPALLNLVHVVADLRRNRPDPDLEVTAAEPGWCAPVWTMPYWTALTAMAEAVGGLSEIDIDPPEARARLVDRGLHEQMETLHREARTGWRNGALLYHDQCLAARDLVQAFLALDGRPRLRRCAFSRCPMPYFLDASASGRQTYCIPAHRVAGLGSTAPSRPRGGGEPARRAARRGGPGRHGASTPRRSRPYHAPSAGSPR